MTIIPQILKRSALFAGAVVSASLVLSARAQNVSSSAVSAAATQGNAAGSSVTFPNTITDVVKMVDGGVGNDVIKTYIGNSQSAYRPTASEIIALKDRGVSQDIIVAMLKRDGELRTQAAQTAQAYQTSVNAAAPPVAASPSVAVPAYDYGAQPVVYPVYSSYPVYVYNSYPDYSYWGGVGYAWPFYYRYPQYSYYRSSPRFYPQSFGGFHGGFQGGFHGSFNGGFHGGVSFQGHSGGSRSPGFGGRMGGGRSR